LETPFKNIAWNGISLDVPMEWSFVTLDHDHLLMGENNDPVLEITWTMKPLGGSLETQMERFSLCLEKRFGMKVSSLVTPLNPVKSHLKMTMAPFAWESASSRGKGFLIRCSQCRRISMLRFFARDKTKSPWDAIGLSYDDMCGGKGVDWNLFGLKLSTPEGFNLITYSFRPGSFMMEFKAQGQRLIVYSWGPASFLLLRDGLEEFARKRLFLPDKIPLAGECSEGSFLVWQWSRLPWPFGFMQRHERFKVIHNRKNNRILGFKYASRSRDGWKIIKGLMGQDVIKT